MASEGDCGAGHAAGGWGRLVLALSVIGLLAACAGAPPEVDNAGFSYIERAEVQADHGIGVSASALGGAESETLFGVPLNRSGIQPVWIRVANQRDEPLWLFPMAVDANYFPAYEVARRAARGDVSVDELYDRLRAVEMPVVLPPRSVSSGFIYASSDEGMKAFNIELHTPTMSEVFTFVVPVPGFPFDYLEIADNGLDPQRGRRSLDEQQLLAWLETFTCCTANAEGEAGDPLNIVLVGSFELVREVLIARHWDATVPSDSEAVMQMVEAFFSGSRYRYAPISALYVMAREHDLAFQKARDVIEERNHLRLWLAPVTYKGTDVWIGQISRDVGVKLTGKLWPPTTHIIDPDVDGARFHLLQDLLEHGTLARVGYARSDQPATFDAPRLNAEGDPYFTDGLRAVFFLSDTFVPASEITLLPWRLPPALEPYRDIFIDDDA